MTPRITLALGRNYDRTRAIVDGRVPVRGVDLIPMVLNSVEETFFRMGRFKEFDVAEMSMSSYMVLRSRDDCPFIGIPVFPSRMFRHSFIFVNRAAGIHCPADLRGKIVGVPEYPMTAAMWIRGLLHDEYGVTVESLDWRVGGEEHSGRTPLVLDDMKFQLPTGVTLLDIPPEDTLSSMLADGRINALMAARPPSSFRDGTGRVGRLFEDYHDREREYYQKTHIFPIMHLIVIKAEVYERYPWLAVNLMQAFETAKAIALEEIGDTTALLYTLPFLATLLDEQQLLFGADPWPYGVEPNLPTLEAMVRYSFQQGLSARLLPISELFAPETYSAARI